MHWTILLLLKRYVQTQYDHSAWVNLLELAGLGSASFDHKTVCPDENLYVLADQAAEAAGVSAGKLHKRFGKYLVPDLTYIPKAGGLRLAHAGPAGAHHAPAGAARTRRTRTGRQVPERERSAD